MPLHFNKGYGDNRERFSFIHPHLLFYAQTRPHLPFIPGQSAHVQAMIKCPCSLFSKWTAVAMVSLGITVAMVSPSSTSQQCGVAVRVSNYISGRSRFEPLFRSGSLLCEFGAPACSLSHLPQGCEVKWRSNNIPIVEGRQGEYE